MLKSFIAFLKEFLKERGKVGVGEGVEKPAHNTKPFGLMPSDFDGDPIDMSAFNLNIANIIDKPTDESRMYMPFGTMRFGNDMVPPERIMPVIIHGETIGHYVIDSSIMHPIEDLIEPTRPYIDIVSLPQIK